MNKITKVATKSRGTAHQMKERLWIEKISKQNEQNVLKLVGIKNKSQIVHCKEITCDCLNGKTPSMFISLLN